jgi:hypothetical protein
MSLTRIKNYDYSIILNIYKEKQILNIFKRLFMMWDFNKIFYFFLSLFKIFFSKSLDFSSGVKEDNS